MRTIKDELPDFYIFSATVPVKRLKDKMLEVCNEQKAYVADEILLLSEEILSQVAAYGVCLYLQHGENLQTEKNNDYILHDLFLNEGHQNAGPIFYRVCNIIQEINSSLSDLQKELFESGSIIYNDLNKLAEFRNTLMHGFFKLPAERNLEIVKEIQVILEKLLNHYEIFKQKGDFHFWKKEGFKGHWNIQDNNDWDNLAGDLTPFEKLASRSNDELHSADFVNSVSVNHDPSSGLEQKGEVEGFITRESDFKESLYVQFHPVEKKRQNEFYANTFKLLNERTDLKIISYSIDSQGIGYTAYLLFHKICKAVDISMPKKDMKDKIVKAVKKEKKKIVILINNIHLLPFASDHITSLMKFFKESGIYFIGIGWEYEHLNSNFSQKLKLRKDRNEIPEEKEIQQLIKNHTRHRGPYEGEDDFKNLNGVIHLICKKIKNNQPVIARQLADFEKIDIELINEALYILYPYLKYDQNGEDNIYIKDEPDELYEFPKNQTETSSIFLILGRRDIDLEYKHKILKL